MSDLEEKAVDILDKLENIITSYAPEVTEAALAVIQISALQDLLFGFISIPLLFAAFFGGIRMASFCNKKDEETCGDDWIGGIVISVALALTISIISIIGIYGLLDVWTWVAIFNPELALVHQITGL